jgi:two-component system, NtrC family, sensor kinase
VQASLHFLTLPHGRAAVCLARRQPAFSPSVSPLRALFSTEIFMPRGHEYLWTPKLLLLEGASNVILALATAVIGTSFLRRRKAVARPLSRRTATALALFAFFAAVTFLGEVWLIWAPLYWLDALVRCLAAVAAVGASVALVTDRGDR